MKSTTSKIATSKLAKLNANKTSIAYQLVTKVINGAKEIRTCYTSGAGRYCSNQDHTAATKDLLNKLGIEFVFSNDSPRGGLTGNLITVTTKIK